MQTTLSQKQSQRLARLALNDMATIKPGEEPDDEPGDNGGGNTSGGGTDPDEGGGDLGD